MRTAIARRMTLSKQQIPHFYVTTDIDMDAVLDALQAANADRPADGRLTLSAVLVKAVALTLAAHPRLNATWTEAGLVVAPEINVGVAIALDQGLVAPALLGCQRLTVLEIAAALRDLAQRATAGRLRSSEVTEATFTVSNLGMFDVAAFTAIINPPQVAILATGRVESRPIVRHGQVVVRSMMTATLSADHRAIDGADSARFLTDLKARLGQPSEWLLDPNAPAATSAASSSGV